jgi:hypothetical protein
MSLNVGSKLGAFEITALGGAGGRGEVWRARRTQLLDLTLLAPDLQKSVGAQWELRLYN